MNANTNDEGWIVSADSRARPLYFRSGQQSIFGWLHWPLAEPAADIGMVICNPFGYEAICAHRSLRAFAQAAAAMGIPALRFDYRGTGDSEDVDPLENQLAVWSQDVAAAIGELKRRSGVARLCIMGFRLGVVAAILAVAARDDVSALIAVAPVTSGRRYLRELRTIQMAAGQGVDGAADGTRALEVSGFSLAAATVAALKETEISALDLRKLEEILVIDRSESPGARPWADGLGQKGAEVHYVALAGFVRMMMTAPHLALIPQAMIAATGDWLTRFTVGRLSRGALPPQMSSSAVYASERNFSFAAAQSDAGVTETCFLIPGKAKLFAIVTESSRNAVRGRGVILLNAGATHHIGPNRMYVTLARRWVEQGFLVLRIDLAGLGDSAAPPGREANEVYPAQAVDEIRAAVDLMQRQYGVTDIAIGGLCSGAYHALRAAVANVPVTRILMVNPLNFFRRDGMTQSDLQWLGFVHNPEMYRRQVIPSRFWKKLFAGQVKVGRLLKIHAQHTYEVLQWRVRDAARMLRVRLPRDLGNDMAVLASRNVDIVLLFSRGDPGIALLRHQAGSTLERLGQRCRIHTIDGADHIFSQSGPRATLESLLGEELVARAAPARDSSQPGGMQIKEEQIE